MLSERSLQHLVDVSEHKKLSKTLKSIVLTPLRIINSTDPPVPYGSSVPTYLPEEERMWRKAFSSQQSFTTRCRDLEMLTRAFTQLTELRTVIFVEGYVHATHWPTGTRGIDEEWTDSRSRVQPNGFSQSWAQRCAQRVFMITLEALARAGARPTRIEMKRHARLLDDSCFHIPDDLRLSMISLLENVKSLTLNLKLEETRPKRALSVSFRHPSTHWQTERVEPNYSESLQQFLSHMSSLEHLTLGFNADLSSTEPFLTWLGLCPGVPRDVSQQRWPRTPEVPPCSWPLKKLGLIACNVTGETLMALVRKFGPTLRVFSLDEPHLCSPPPKGPHQRLESRGTTITWKDIIQSLANHAKLLTLFKLLGPRTCFLGNHGRIICHVVGFTGLKEFAGAVKFHDGDYWISYSDTRLGEYLNDLSLHLNEVGWIPRDSGYCAYSHNHLRGDLVDDLDTESDDESD